MSDDPEARIVECLRDCTLVPVLGAGFSAATARLPGWPRLISSGFDYVDELGICDAELVKNARDALDPTSVQSLINGARTLKEFLGAPYGQYPAWLEHELTVSDDTCSLGLLNAVADLLAPIVATTNYDKLLSSNHPNPDPVTWRDAAAMAGLFHARGRKVFHLHGIYDRADTVVFGDDDYDALVGSAAYRAVLQTLWLDRTLLFIGCSFDGLQDPDFLRFLEWTTKTFPGLTHEHYALVRTGDITTAARRRLLLESRVRVIEYGATHDELPEWLVNVNPSRDKALDLRRARARQVLETGGVIEFAAILSGLATKSTFTSVASYADAARPLFDRHARTLTRDRNELSAMQTLTRQMVNESDLRAALDLWDDHRKVHAAWDLFYDTALAAGNVLFVFERRVLARLWRLDAGVHTYSVTGGLFDELEHARRLPESAQRDRYTQENLARILRSVASILDADPAKLFPVPEPGHHAPPNTDLLVVTRRNGVELRVLSDPENVVGFLPETPPSLRAVEPATIGGVPVLIAYNAERVTAWDPYGTDVPVAEFRLDQLPLDQQDLLGIFDVAHHQTNDGLVSSLVIGAEVHWLLDLKWVGSTDIRDKSVMEQLWLGDDALFAVGAHGERVIRIDRDGARSVLHGSELFALLRTMPQPPPDDAVFDNMRLRAVQVDGRMVLGIRARMRNGGLGSVIALIDPFADSPQLLGAWLSPEQAAVSFTSMTDDDGSTLLVACCLRDYREARDLVRCARGVRTNRGLVFVEERSGVQTDSDLIDVMITPRLKGFAADSLGRLIQFDLASGMFTQIGETRPLLGVCRFPPAR
jgi:hypothetical protein